MPSTSLLPTIIELGQARLQEIEALLTLIQKQKQEINGFVKTSKETLLPYYVETRKLELAISDLPIGSSMRAFFLELYHLLLEKIKGGLIDEASFKEILNKQEGYQSILKKEGKFTFSKLRKPRNPTEEEETLFKTISTIIGELKKYHIDFHIKTVSHFEEQKQHLIALIQLRKKTLAQAALSSNGEPFKTKLDTITREITAAREKAEDALMKHLRTAKLQQQEIIKNYTEQLEKFGEEITHQLQQTSLIVETITQLEQSSDERLKTLHGGKSTLQLELKDKFPKKEKSCKQYSFVELDEIYKQILKHQKGVDQASEDYFNKRELLFKEQRETIDRLETATKQFSVSITHLRKPSEVTSALNDVLQTPEFLQDVDGIFSQFRSTLDTDQKYLTSEHQYLKNQDTIELQLEIDATRSQLITQFQTDACVYDKVQPVIAQPFLCDEDRLRDLTNAFSLKRARDLLVDESFSASDGNSLTCELGYQMAELDHFSQNLANQMTLLDQFYEEHKQGAVTHLNTEQFNLHQSILAKVERLKKIQQQLHIKKEEKDFALKIPEGDYSFIKEQLDQRDQYISEIQEQINRITNTIARRKMLLPNQIVTNLSQRIKKLAQQYIESFENIKTYCDNIQGLKTLSFEALEKISKDLSKHQQDLNNNKEAYQRFITIEIDDLVAHKVKTIPNPSRLTAPDQDIQLQELYTRYKSHWEGVEDEIAKAKLSILHDLEKHPESNYLYQKNTTYSEKTNLQVLWLRRNDNFIKRFFRNLITFVIPPLENYFQPAGVKFLEQYQALQKLHVGASVECKTEPDPEKRMKKSSSLSQLPKPKPSKECRETQSEPDRETQSEPGSPTLSEYGISSGSIFRPAASPKAESIDDEIRVISPGKSL